MAEKITFTYAGLSGQESASSEATGAASQRPAASSASIPAVVPVLRPLDLFPTRIWQSHLAPFLPHLSQWANDIAAMRAASPKAAGRTNRRGWNSEDMSVLERPGFAALRYAIRAACAGALGEMGQSGRAFRLQSWVNMHDRGGFNFSHMHEGTLLSGSFYVKIPLGAGQFVFRDPRPGVIHGSVKGAVPNGHADIHLAPSAGLLVLFPCWVEHYVELHESDEPRITLAFNALDAASP
jgi:uncharacterized protein (TIGR02466 family)